MNARIMFFESGMLDSITPLLEGDDPESQALVIELFSDDESSRFRHSLIGSKALNVIIAKAMEGHEQFIRILGLCVK